MRGEQNDGKSIKQFTGMIFHLFIRPFRAISLACPGLEMCGFSLLETPSPKHDQKHHQKKAATPASCISNNSNGSNSLCFRNPSCTPSLNTPARLAGFFCTTIADHQNVSSFFPQKQLKWIEISGSINIGLRYSSDVGILNLVGLGDLHPNRIMCFRLLASCRGVDLSFAQVHS